MSQYNPSVGLACRGVHWLKVCYSMEIIVCFQLEIWNFVKGWPLEFLIINCRRADKNDGYLHQSLEKDFELWTRWSMDVVYFT